MDLGISGRQALVCAASAGLGRACAMALAKEGVAVTITGRTVEKLEATAREIRQETGVAVQIAPGDIATEEGRATALALCPAPDILINNAGGPPPGDLRRFDRDNWIAALDANMLAPVLLIKAVVDGMCERKFGRIVNITSAAVKGPMANLDLSNGARCGLTGAVAALARQVAADNVTINALLPGPFLTDRARKLAAAGGGDVEAALADRASRNPARRYGQPDEFGATCAFLCSAQASYMVGQNLVIDGGALNYVFG